MSLLYPQDAVPNSRGETEPLSEAATALEGAPGALQVGETDAGGRLDQWLTAQLAPALSRSRIQALIRDGQVTVGARAVVEPKQKLAAGDRVTISLPEPEAPEPSGEAIPLTVLFEDDEVIVIDKPAGLVVHPGPGNWTGTLVNALIHHCGETLSGIGGVRRPGIVHRLDKETSGVMVAAKTDNAHRKLSAAFAAHGADGAMERAYQAIVWGVPDQTTGVIDAALGRADDRVRRAVVPAGRADARHAVTHYTVLETFGSQRNAALVECRLETGRTHQIRVHMAHLGHPLVGDPDYARGFRTKANRLPEPQRVLADTFSRQALHAAHLAFEHPRTGELLSFQSALPRDMAELTAAFRALA